MQYAKSLTIGLPNYSSVKIGVVEASSFEECDLGLVEELRNLENNGVPIRDNIWHAVGVKKNTDIVQGDKIERWIYRDERYPVYVLRSYGDSSHPKIELDYHMERIISDIEVLFNRLQEMLEAEYERFEEEN